MEYFIEKTLVLHAFKDIRTAGQAHRVVVYKGNYWAHFAQWINFLAISPYVTVRKQGGIRCFLLIWLLWFLLDLSLLFFKLKKCIGNRSVPLSLWEMGWG